jgi:DNA-binding SARP family transcriptional activator/Tfp pilus assembly protein PilF
MPAGTQRQQQTASTPNVRVYTLGTFRVLVGEQAIEEHAWRRRTARQLFKVLLTRPGRRMTRDEVVELFWPDSDSEAAASNLRSTLYAMRRALENARGARAHDVIFGDHTSVWLGPEPELWMDAMVFEQTVADAWRSPDPLPLLEEASALYAGDFLPDDLYEDWASERREALKRTWTELQFGLTQALEAHSDVNAALQPLERLLRADACDERAAQEQMKLLTRYGRRAEAMRVYQRLQQSLRRELGVEPSPDTTELQRQIGAGEAVAAPPIPAAAFRCTYPFPVPSELVGREDELGVLWQVVSGGRTAGRIALVGAPAGTGKSALLGQIVRQAQAQGVLCLAGGCYAERGAVPLGPFHDALVDFLLAQAPESIRAQMAAYVDDLAEVIPELRYHLQLTADVGAARGSRDRMRAFGAVHACLRSLAEMGPVLMCLEDLHAADEATLQLLHYLARQTRRLPLVMVATYRDDETPAEPMAQTLAALVRERLAQSIKLNSLGPGDTHRLVGSMLDGSPSHALGESLYETTGGNPLFLEQLVLALEETGQLERKAGVWHGTGELHGTPRIVREVIAQRVQQFDASAREVLDMASVLGQSFEHRVVLAAVARRDEASLLRDVDRAITAQVLQDTPGGYAFRHALLRDAVYYALTGPRRMLLHGQVAEVLEQVYGARADEHAAEIAYHFGLAGESPELRAKRLHYNLIAGRRAAHLSAYPQALDHFSRAWEIIQQDASFPDVELQVEVLQGRGWAETQMARWRDTIATYRQALGLIQDPLARSRAYGLIGFAFAHVGDLLQVGEECSSGLAELVGQDGPEVTSARLQLQQVLAGTLHWQGHYRELVQLGQAMQAEAARVDQPRPRLLANLVTAWGYWGMGQIQKATEHVQRAIQAGELIEERLQIAINYENLGLVAQSGGQFDAARRHLEHALELFGQSANELRAVNSLQTLCRVWLAQGEAARAREQLMRVLPLEVAGSERWAADGYCILAHIQSFAAEWDDAAANFQQAIQMRQGAGHRAGAVEASVGLGLVYQRTGRWAEAEASFDSAVRIASQMDTSPPLVMAQRHKGLLRLVVGDVEGAAIAIEDAYALARQMPESLEFSPSILAVAAVRARQGDCHDVIDLAREALDNARSVHQIIDAHTLLGALYYDIGEADLARQHAKEAVARAELLGSPWLLSGALVCLARASSASDAAATNEVFERAIQLAEQAGAPYERAQAMDAYAARLRATNQPGPRLMWVEAEALRIHDELAGLDSRAAVADE